MTRDARQINHLPPMIERTAVKHVVFYWLFCMTLASAPLLLGKVLVEPQKSFFVHIQELTYRYWPLWVTMIGVLPFAIKDAVRVLNRIVGPLHRLQSQIENVNNGEPYRPVGARDNDFMGGLLAAANRAFANRGEGNLSAE